MASGPAWAQLSNEALRCEPDEPELDLHRYLRALSLDLRGVVPTVEEHDAVEAAGEVGEALVDEWLASEEFVVRSVRYHRDLLWNSLSNVRLNNNRVSLNSFRVGSGDRIYWRNGHADRYRGTPGRVRCRDVPATFDEAGDIEFEVDEEGHRLEGWVLARPYWDPTTPIKVCAYDAQDALTTSEGLDCSTAAALNDAECGCGPDLRWCVPGAVNGAVVGGMAEAMDRRIARLVRDDRPYTELFTDRRAFVNGPIVHFWRHLRAFPRGLQFDPPPVGVEQLPELAYTDIDTWAAVDLSAAHAGVLTDPAFLLRFQTNRARANRYYASFLCQPFAAPPGGLPSPADGCSSQPDLQRRCGCKYCHALLEPTAAHWGRWAEQGVGFLDPTRFPRTRADCEACALRGQQCNAECRRFYVTDSVDPREQPNLGGLRAYEFRRPEHERNVEAGPRLLALSTVTDNRLPMCSFGGSWGGTSAKRRRPGKPSWPRTSCSGGIRGERWSRPW